MKRQINCFKDSRAKEVFEDEKVWDCLGGYLGPGDLKDCRLVCKTFDAGVKGCRRWKEGMQLHLTKENWSDKGITSLQVGPTSAVKVTLSASGPAEAKAMSKLLKIFETVRSLTLELEDGEVAFIPEEEEGEEWWTGFDEEDEWWEGCEEGKGWGKVTWWVGLEEEKLEERIWWRPASKAERMDQRMDRERRQKDFEDKYLKRWAPNVIKLTTSVAVILSHCSPKLEALSLKRNLITILNVFQVVSVRCPPVLARIRGLKTLEVYENFYNPRHLEEECKRRWPKFNPCFHFPCIGTAIHILLTNFFKGEELALIPALWKDDFFPRNGFKVFLEERGPALRKLVLGDGFDFGKISDIAFPNLTHFSLAINPYSKRNGRPGEVSDFLLKQQPLKSLTLKLRDSLTKDLLQAVRARCEELSALTLSCWKLEEGLGWRWLKRCGKLKAFSLTTPSGEWSLYDGRLRRVTCCIEDILLALPEKGVKKIRLRSGNGVVGTKTDLRDVLDDPKFSSLEELSLLVKGVVSDAVIEVIGSRGRFPQLRKLHLAYSQHESGELKGDKDFWKGLRDVSLRNIFGVLSPDSLAEQLEGSKEMRHFTLRDFTGDFPSALVGFLVERNKSLETLVINNHSVEAEAEEGQKVKGRRLRKVKFLPPTLPSARDADSDSEPEEEGGGGGRRWVSR